MEMKKYKVEAFIIPTYSRNKESDSENVSQNDKPDEKILSEFSEVFFKIDEPIYDEIIVPVNKEIKKITSKEENSKYTKAFFKIEEPIYDEPFVSNLFQINSKNINNNYDRPQNRWVLATSKYQHFRIVAPKLPKRSSSLKSIFEDIECFDETLDEVSCACKNKCLIDNNEHPEDISDEIFKQNWIQRLNSLRKLQTLLKDKEVALQSRETLLFKKEKELRILERLVKDKMRQVELYAKRYKKSLSSESIINEKKILESNSSSNLKDHSKIENLLHSTNLVLKLNSKNLEENNSEKVLKNLSNTQNFVLADKLRSKVSTVKSKSRPRQQVKYDDLDSTLSADIGDSSFIVTSKRFDLYSLQRPAAFVRSASARYPSATVNEIHPKMESPISALRFNRLTEKNMNEFFSLKEEKMFKKVNDNILAPQEQETKFLNYGLIDKQSSVNMKSLDRRKLIDQKRFSYLNLEFRNKITKLYITKARPTSWNEDADDWLKKKREAYNLSTQKINNKDAIAGKENIDKQAKIDKFGKTIKRKDNWKKFSIFR